MLVTVMCLCQLAAKIDVCESKLSQSSLSLCSSPICTFIIRQQACTPSAMDYTSFITCSWLSSFCSIVSNITLVDRGKNVNNLLSVTMHHCPLQEPNPRLLNCTMSVLCPALRCYATALLTNKSIAAENYQLPVTKAPVCCRIQ